MLAQNVAGEAVRVHVGAALRIGDHVHFAMRLLERLGHALRGKITAPAQHAIGILVERMPERDSAVIQVRDGLPGGVADDATLRQAGDRLSASIEAPDEAPHQPGQQRMVEISFAPLRQTAWRARTDRALRCERTARSACPRSPSSACAPPQLRPDPRPSALSAAPTTCAHRVAPKSNRPRACRSDESSPRLTRWASAVPR